VVVGLGAARGLVMVRHDPPFHPKPQALAMAGQNVRNGSIPGFWLPDQWGRRTGLHDLGPGPFVIAFWSPARPDSLDGLAHLQRLHETFSGSGLRVVAICLADDWSVARRVARERGYRFPMLTDTGCHWADKLADSAPLAEAYEVADLPAIYLADASRRLVTRWDGLMAGTWADLEDRVSEAMAQTKPGAEGVGPGG
jgi:hypothetical protein